MRNTVFKTAALAGLFLCMLMLAGAFSGITTSAHAVHADEVDTQAELEQFVKEAVDEYYIEFLMKEHCNFEALLPDNLPVPLSAALGILFPDIDIQDLSPESIQGLSTDEVKQLISTLGTIEDHPIFGPIVRNLFPDGIDIWGSCDSQPTSTFRDVFTEEEENWLSGSIYLFVMNDQARLFFHGADQSVENTVLDVEDEAGQNVGELIVEGAEASDGSFVKYCWDDPDLDGDEIVDSNGDPIEGKAPGDSLKVSYVIDPFSSLGVPGPSGSPGIIFGSGIYPEMPDPDLPQCDGDGEPEPMEPPMEPTEPMEPPMEPTEPMEPPMEPTEPMEPPMEPEPTSVSGGGCAITGGGDSTPRNDALNLLLMASTLFLAVSFGNRAAGRRNGIRS